MLRQLTTIARNTFVESIRQPIFSVLVLLGALMLVLNVMLSAYSMEVSGPGDDKMLLDMGLSTIALIGLLLAAFTATGVISREIENKTVLTVVSKPVNRPVFVLGKFFGVGAAIMLSCYILSLILLLTVRHEVMSTARDPLDGPVISFGFGAGVISLVLATWGNYYLRRVFTSTFIVTLAITETLAFAGVLVVGKGWVLQAPWQEFTVNDGRMGQIVIGLVMVHEAVLLLAAAAVAASTRLGQVMTLMVCAGLFALGLMTQSLAQYVNYKLSLPHDLSVAASFSAIWQTDLGTPVRLVYSAVQAIYAVFPNLQFLWPADAISQDNPFTMGYVLNVTAYTGLQLTAILAIAVALFQKREVG